MLVCHVTFSAIKDKTTGEFLLNGGGKQGPGVDQVIHGTKFSYKSKGSEQLIASGPLLAPVEIMVSTGIGKVTYITHLKVQKDF